ncbi:hypothetical protein B0H17DRAFT_1207617 [Mycena rosella]|uniref:Uncharacterized protein n=1 Tax=Mycena rosella TaxID=1033263 RepID=A0AAD7D666_MYCRO|nr:hypothetical protein B0H17DRAFT_1207617 [Mycena rosella]
MRANTSRLAGDAVLLARTSKIFQYALDLLWKEQNDLLPLVKCMPLDLWETEEQPTLKFVGLRRPVRASDLDRLLFYSHRVKLFVVHEDMNVAVDGLRTCLAGQVLFPNLMALVWGRPEGFCSDLPLFLSPKIQHLGLALQDSPPHLEFLSTLTLRYPVLKSVDINLPPSASTTSGVSDAVCSLRAVTRLTVNTLTVPALLHLAGLQDLTVFNLLSVGDVCVPDTLPDERFADLAHLSVGANSIEQCTALVRFFSAAPLSTGFLALSGVDPSPASAWATFASALRDHCAHPALRSLFVYHGSIPLPPDSPPRPTGAALRPLFAFPHLVSVVLEPPDGFDLDAALLHDMARAWPALEKLALGVSASNAGPRISLPALLPFALHCPKLQTLGFVLDATASLDAELAELDGGHCSLRRLLLGQSAITEGDVAGVARFLVRVFPGLVDVVCTQGHPVTEVWRRVVEEMGQSRKESD